MKNDGGPAFPVPNWYENTPCGMTLRDYFAAKAMVGLFTDKQYGPRDWKLAEEAYRYADLMIAARETK